jgi:VanZ family protein
VLLVAAHAFLDEYHQSFTPSRTASVGDSLLDIAGGLVGLFLRWLRRRRPTKGQ